MTFKEFRNLFVRPMKCHISIVRWEGFLTPYYDTYFTAVSSNSKKLDEYLDFEVARIDISDDGCLCFDLVEVE